MYVIIYIFYIFLTDFVYSWFYASWTEGDYPSFLRPVSVPKRHLQKTAQRGPSTPWMSKPSVAHLATARGSHCNLLQQCHSTTALLNAWILAWPSTNCQSCLLVPPNGPCTLTQWMTNHLCKPACPSNTIITASVHSHILPTVSLTTTAENPLAAWLGNLPTPQAHASVNCATRPVFTSPTLLNQQPCHHCKTGRRKPCPQCSQQNP